MRLLLLWLVLVAASQLVVHLRSPSEPRDAARLVEIPEPANETAATEPPASETTATDERRIQLEVEEYGEPDADLAILALHGAPTGGGDFARFADALIDEAGDTKIRLIAPIQPGYGASTPDVDDYGIVAAARNALAVLDELGLDEVHVFAHSLGGGTALVLADLAPERVLSITSYGGIGIQEGEGTGDYDFEHFKYAVGDLLLVQALELVPHFGLAPSRGFRKAAIRNFGDTDQRPLRRLLERLETPFLILHGVHDFLVPISTAREHHALVPHSSLVVFDRSHFMVFDDEGARSLAEEHWRFLETVTTNGGNPQEPRVVDPFEPIDETIELPGNIELGRGQNPSLQFSLIVLATFVLEDPTSVAIGFAIRQGFVDWFLGLAACIFGIFVGDLGLYLIGFLAARTRFGRKFVTRRVGAERLARLGGWFDQKGWQAIVACRFLPGTRLPVYLAAGWTGRKPLRFALWTLMAGVVWTPMLVLGTAVFGDGLWDALHALFGDSLLGRLAAGILAICLILLPIRLAVWFVSQLSTRRGRLHLRAKCARMLRYEFWPSIALYFPLIPFYARLRFTKGSLVDATCVNPVWVDSGFIGESKQVVLDRFPKDSVLESFLVMPGSDGKLDLGSIASEIRRRGFGWPVIVKPDQGQRGTGVKRVDGPDQLAEKLDDVRVPMVVQRFHPGPYELGLFWWRLPDAESGRLFSICEKVFPTVTGNGRRSLEQLILADRRLFLQHEMFFERLGERLAEVPADGEIVSLGSAGNHAQGCLFQDGEHWRTPEVEAWLDRACSAAEGYHFGRLDVRFTDPEAFRRGEGGQILEANGITSESTNLYDPRFTIWTAWRLLREPWHAILAIGKANRRRGEGTGIGWFTLVGRLRRWRREGRLLDVAD